MNQLETSSWKNVTVSWRRLKIHDTESAIADFEDEMRKEDLVPAGVTKSSVKSLGAYLLYQARRKRAYNISTSRASEVPKVGAEGAKRLDVTKSGQVSQHEKNENVTGHSSEPADIEDDDLFEFVNFPDDDLEDDA